MKPSGAAGGASIPTCDGAGVIACRNDWTEIFNGPDMSVISGAASGFSGGRNAFFSSVLLFATNPPLPVRIPLASLLLIVFALSTGGCVQTAMLPADQLEDGQTIVSASATEPGAGLFPQLSAQATYGFGEGDLTGTVSGLPALNFLALGAGVTGRYYVSTYLSAELQLQVSSFLREDESRRRTAGLVLFGLQTVPSDEASWYYGTQAGIITEP